MASRPTTAYRRRILDNFLTCGICHEPYKKPVKALPCQHSFCQECLENQHSASTGRSLKCSVCRHLVTLPKEGVAGLPNNHDLANLCEEFSKKTQVGGQKNRCGFHPTKDVDLFCQQCEVPICTECIRDAHSGHTVAGVKQAAPKIKAIIKAQLNSGQQKIETFSAFLNKIEDVEKRITDNKTKVQQQIHKAYEKQVQKLQEQRDRLLKTVEKSHHDNRTALAGQKDIVLTQLNELSRVCEDAEEHLEQEDAVWLTQDFNLSEKLAKFKNILTPEICATKLCSFEPKASGTLIELGKVTSKSLSGKQALYQSKETDTGQVRCTNVRPIRVGQPWVKKVSFGGRGSGRGEFMGPMGVAVSQDKEVYIADWDNSRIQVFTMDGSKIKELKTTLLGETRKTLTPCDAAVDRNGNLWVVGEDRVVQYSREGYCLIKIALPYVTYVRGITVSIATEQVIVTEHNSYSGLLKVFSQDVYELGIYGSGHRSPEPWWPCCVTVDGYGNILVTDDNNHCVHVLDREGNFKFKFGSKGSDDNQLKNPLGICVDGMGNIIVADRGNGCVKMFDSQGRFLCHIGSGMNDPCGVAVSPGGDVVVTEYGNHNVSVWTQG